MDDELASPSRFFSMDGKPGGGKEVEGGGGNYRKIFGQLIDSF